MLGCSVEADDGGLGALDSADEENEFDLAGRLDIDMQRDFATKPGKKATFGLHAADTNPFDVRVDSDEGELVLELHGPLNPETGKLGPLRERSQLTAGTGAHVFGFAPPKAGFYIALVSDVRDRAIPITLSYTAADSEAVRFDLAGSLRGGRHEDAADAAEDWEAACAQWKTLMLRLSVAKIQNLDCGAPDNDDDHVSSIVRARFAVTGAAFAEPESVEQPAIEASSADGWLAMCTSRLLAAKEMHGEAMLGGSCGLISSSASGVGDVIIETIRSRPVLFLAP